MSDQTPTDEDMRVAMSLLEVRDLVARQQELIDILAVHARSHHDALLQQTEDQDHILYRLEQLEGGSNE